MSKIKIDPDDLDIDELEELDDLLPGGFQSLMGGGVPVKAMRVIAYLIQRRTDPEYTLEQAGKIKLSDFDLGDSGEDAAAAT